MAKKMLHKESWATAFPLGLFIASLVSKSTTGFVLAGLIVFMVVVAIMEVAVRFLSKNGAQQVKLKTFGQWFRGQFSREVKRAKRSA